MAPLLTSKFGFLVALLAPSGSSFSFRQDVIGQRWTSTQALVSTLCAVNGDATAVVNDQVPVKGSNSQDEALSKDAFHIWDNIAAHTADTLYQSDLHRDGTVANSPRASSATNWIHHPTALVLQQTLNKVALRSATDDESLAWLKWLTNMPCPSVWDLSDHLRAQVQLSESQLQRIGQTRNQFVARIGCRLVVLPSGTKLCSALVEPPASILYGKLLQGGVRRQLKHRQNASGRVAVKSTPNENVPVWMQYGGPERTYHGLDMGVAVLLEVVLLPQGKVWDRDTSTGSVLTIQNSAWKPPQMFDSFVNDSVQEEAEPEYFRSSSLSGRARNEAFRQDFVSVIGGLQPQIDAVVRRVLDGRVIRPADQDESESKYFQTALEAEELELLGLSPVRGLLLFGPPGCGKTLLAREIAKALRARTPKIVAAPELLDRWVGGSEKLVRLLFADAEAELAACGGDATKSALHVVVIDEIDAVFRKRSSSEDSGEATRSSVVNQVLAKLDGVKVGMTNRRELLDDALLRPGRLEVQIEVPLPNREGRREILNIHFGALRKKGRLSQPLCEAIDGCTYNSKLRRQLSRRFDLADATKGFSGAELAGLVRCAGSLALSRCRQDGSGLDNLLITLEDVKQSLKEVKR